VHAGRATPELHLAHFLPLEEIEKVLCRRIEALDLKQLADQTAQTTLDRLRGRV
jgi:hypothetical protein